MTGPAQLVHLLCSRTRESKWEGLMRWMQCETGWDESKRLYAYRETPTDCMLECLSFKEAQDRRVPNSEIEVPFEGRLFESAVEARWRHLPNGDLVAAILREEQEHGTRPSGERMVRLDRRYYLRGEYHEDDDKDTFREARYPEPFRYPVQAAARRDRAYVKVAEYWRRESCWSKLDDEKVCEMLALPLLQTHRFFGVGVGRD